MAASNAAPGVLRALLVPLTGCIALWGCTTTPRVDELPRPLNSARSVEAFGTAERTYYLPLNITTPASLSVKGPGFGFDLLDHPEDICISLRSDPMPLTMKRHYLRSNSVR